jgi:hypothetical protein
MNQLCLIEASLARRLMIRALGRWANCGVSDFYQSSNSGQTFDLMRLTGAACCCCCMLTST